MTGKIVAGIIAITLVVVGISFYLSPDDLAHCSIAGSSDECQPADAIIVVSGGDTTARTAEAIRLFQENWATYIVFSGAAADKDGPSNARVMRQQAIDSGVPIGSTIIEEQSETTKQNAEQVQDSLREQGIRRVILVTSGYHMKRVSLEFSRQLGGSVELVRHPVPKDRQWSNAWWLTPHGWYLAVSELAKIVAFYTGGSR